MSWTIAPRPRDATAELALSRDERATDLQALGGRAGLGEIRRRLEAVRRLKHAAGDRPVGRKLLDQVVPRR